MRTLWIARHGNRKDFADPTWAATASRPHDPGLAPDGVAQSRKLGHRLQNAAIDRVLASPFLRTIQTAHHVTHLTGHAVRLEPGLGEWRNPDWFDAPPSLLPEADLNGTFSRLRFDHAPCHTAAYPETKAESLRRIGATGRCLADRFSEESLLLIGHGITVWGLLNGFFDDIADTGCPLASLTELVEDDQGWHLVRRNDVSHLDDGAQQADRMA